MVIRFDWKNVSVRFERQTQPGLEISFFELKQICSLELRSFNWHRYHKKMDVVLVFIIGRSSFRIYYWFSPTRLFCVLRSSAHFNTGEEFIFFFWKLRIENQFGFELLLGWETNIRHYARLRYHLSVMSDNGCQTETYISLLYLSSLIYAGNYLVSAGYLRCIFIFYLYGCGGEAFICNMLVPVCMLL